MVTWIEMEPIDSRMYPLSPVDDHDEHERVVRGFGDPDTARDRDSAGEPFIRQLLRYISHGERDAHRLDNAEPFSRQRDSEWRVRKLRGRVHESEAEH